MLCPLLFASSSGWFKAFRWDNALRRFRTCVLQIPKAGNNYRLRFTRSSIYFIKMVKSPQNHYQLNFRLCLFFFVVPGVSSAILKCRNVLQSAIIAFLGMRGWPGVAGWTTMKWRHVDKIALSQGGSWRYCHHRGPRRAIWRWWKLCCPPRLGGQFWTSIPLKLFRETGGWWNHIIIVVLLADHRLLWCFKLLKLNCR